MDTENNTQPNIETQVSPVNPKPLKPKKSRNMIYLIIGALAVLGIAYYVVSQQQAKQDQLNLSPKEVEQLPEDEKQATLQAQLASLLEEEKALNAQSDSGDRFTTYIQLAEVYTALGKHNQAIQALDKIKPERLNNTRLWMTYAEVYKNMGNLADARGNARAALNIDDGIADNWLFLIDISKDLPPAEVDKLFQDAMLATEYDPKISQAYEKWKTENPQS